MTDPQIFHVPLMVLAAEQICEECENGFYRPCGPPVAGIITPNSKGQTGEQYPHRCGGCGHQRNFDTSYPRIDYAPALQLEWHKKEVREEWAKQQKESN